ncbi:major capsid protein [Nocardia amamiensis]|uniref:Major capsid protein n=1 Tax=Nocardia amamiensis TaxID=404578 RepID=A0ABS0CPN3_9NOCA|nr:major capsid protein [Nocardia amamiensis]MBF6298226.1 major capsid protein [Nocardia amamiensis]
MKITLQSLIDAATGAAEGQSAADAVAKLLAEAPADTDVAALLEAATAKFNELYGDGTSKFTDDEASAMEALADVADGVRVEVGRRDKIAGEQAERLSKLAERVNPAAKTSAKDDDGEGGAEGEDKGGDGGEDGGDTTDAPTEPAAGDPAPPAADSAPAAVAADPAPEPALVASAPPRRRVRLSDLPTREVRRPDPAPAGVVITAAAEVPGYAAGAPMAGLADVARAGTVKFDSFPNGIVENTRLTAGIAQFAIQFPDELITRSDHEDKAAIERAVDQSRLPQQSLVAAGGWCSPSERLYEMSPILAEANAGQIDIPEVQSPRGGLIWTEGPDYTAIYTGTGFIQTEAQAIAGSGFTTPIGGTVAGTTKPIFRVPCPSSWEEERAEAIGFGINGGILQHNAYSELTEDVIAHALIAHAHRVNARTINRMVAETATTVTINLGPSATPSLLNSIDAQIEDIKYANRIGDGTTLEVMLPRWVKPVVRADQAVRTNSSTTEAYEVTDQRIDDWFAKRNAVVRWVYDWQDAFTGISSGFGGATPITSWPDTVDVLVYIAGTFLRSRGDIITMQAVYDTTNLVNNDVLHLFTEEKLMVIRRRYKPRKLTIALSANGSTAAGQILDSDGKIAPAA